jgi:hypothetical protein
MIKMEEQINKKVIFKAIHQSIINLKPKYKSNKNKIVFVIKKIIRVK